jgi:hypothetical protein
LPSTRAIGGGKVTRYAADTSVSVERSKAEIEKTVARYGASGFASAWAGNQARIGFQIEGVQVQLRLELPSVEDYKRSPRGRARDREATQKAWEQACRAQWRALALVVKAKLEAVESGISTLEREFLVDLVVPGGGTVGDQLLPGLAKALQTGRLPPLLGQ